MDLVGSVEDSDVIIVDDMIDTAGTLCKAASVLKEFGGTVYYAQPCPSHVPGRLLCTASCRDLYGQIVAGTNGYTPQFFFFCTKDIDSVQCASCEWACP